MERHMHRLEESQRKTLQAIQKDLHQGGTRLGDTEQAIDTLTDCTDSTQLLLQVHSTMIQNLIYHVDDIENCAHRNNVRIRWLPETIFHAQLPIVLQSICASLLQIPPDGAPVLLDRAHRALGPRKDAS